MALINKSFQLTWQGNADLACSDLTVHDSTGEITPQFKDKLLTSFVADQPGDQWLEAGQQIGIFKEFTKLNCGSASYMKLALNTSLSLSGTTSGTTDDNQGNITTLYPSSFTFNPKFDPETFILTSSFLNDKPVYKTKTGSLKYSFFDGFEYVISTDIGGTKLRGNGACIPNAPYTNNTGTISTDSHFVEVSGFTGAKANLNGEYYHVGYFNGEKTYRDSMCVDHFYYYDNGKWILTDTPFNGQGCYIIGTSDKFGCVDHTLGNNCFDGQRACVFDGNVDPRSLMTEDALKSLATEDSLKVLITEAEL